jgi:hypothetical protein
VFAIRLLISKTMSRLWIALDIVALVIGIASSVAFAIGLGWAVWAAPLLAKWAVAGGLTGVVAVYLLGPRLADKVAPEE